MKPFKGLELGDIVWYKKNDVYVQCKIQNYTNLGIKCGNNTVKESDLLVLKAIYLDDHDIVYMTLDLTSDSVTKLDGKLKDKEVECTFTIIEENSDKFIFNKPKKANIINYGK